MKKLNKDDAELICHKVEFEGLATAVIKGYLDCLIGTEFEETLLKVSAAMRELESTINSIKEEFKIEDLY